MAAECRPLSLDDGVADLHIRSRIGNDPVGLKLLQQLCDLSHRLQAAELLQPCFLLKREHLPHLAAEGVSKSFPRQDPGGADRAPLAGVELSGARLRLREVVVTDARE